MFNLLEYIDPWDCEVCTFKNHTSYYMCTVCGHEPKDYKFKNYGEHLQKTNKFHKLKSVFGKTKIFLPVIHVINKEQTDTCLDICFNKVNVDGVFLINNDCSEDELIEAYKRAKKDYPNKWIGINILGNIFNSLGKINELRPDGFWTDTAGINDDDVGIATFIQSYLAKNKITSLYFGGICFKYRKQPKNPILTAMNATKFVDVVTTTGKGGMIPISLEKLKNIYKGCTLQSQEQKQQSDYEKKRLMYPIPSQ